MPLEQPMTEYYTSSHDGTRLTFTPATGEDVGELTDYRGVWRKSGP